MTNCLCESDTSDNENHCISTEMTISESSELYIC